MAPRQKLPKPSQGISRIDQESTRTHGYVGRVGYRRTDSGWRPQFTAFFGDRSHGGPAEALKAAEKWLRSAKKQLGDGARSVAKAVTPARGAAKKATARSDGRVAAKGGARRATAGTAKRASAKRTTAKRGARAAR